MIGRKIFKCLDEKALYLTKDSLGFISAHEKKPYILENKWKSDGNVYNIGKVIVEEFERKDWRYCILEKSDDPEDWIGYLCWFSSTKRGLGYTGIIGHLKEITKKGEFSMGGSLTWKYCKPVKISELKIYKKKNDE